MFTSSDRGVSLPLTDKFSNQQFAGFKKRHFVLNYARKEKKNRLKTMKAKQALCVNANSASELDAPAQFNDAKR